MKRGSIVGPLILIAIGTLFLVNNLNPELSVLQLLSRFWPFVLIGWGVLRLLEILYQAARGRALPAAGISGGEWVLVVFLALVGSSLFFVSERVNWPSVRIGMRGLEMFGRAYDYTFDEKTVEAGPKPRVLIDNSYGNARVIASDTQEVRVSGRKTVRAYQQRDAEDAARRVDLKLTREGDTVLVQALQETRGDNRFVTTDLEITVPRGARVEARGRRGDFDITGVQGDVQVDSENAGVRLESIGGNVRIELRASDVVRVVGVKGTVDVKGYGHDVEVEDVEGQVTVAGNYFGDLQFRRVAKPVRFEGGLKSRSSEFRAEAVPGQIRMEGGNLMMEGVTGPVVISARSKDVQVSDFTHGLQIKLDRGDVEVRPSRAPVPTIDVTTETGDIELVMPENARFALKASTNRGEVENEFGPALRMEERGRGAILTGSVGDGAQITLRADHGAVRVRKGSPAELAAPLRPPLPPNPPGREIVIQRH